jgi:hypothetical protein
LPKNEAAIDLPHVRGWEVSLELMAEAPFHYSTKLCVAAKEDIRCE